MIAWLHILLKGVAVRFKSKARLEAEILILRHQVNVLRRSARRRLRLSRFGIGSSLRCIGGTVKLAPVGLRRRIGSGNQRHDAVRTFPLHRLPVSA